MKNIAIIPARGGSKRIPKKNIIDFWGKPIIAYTIEAALSSNIFEHVIVSTDSEEIADVALQFGAEVPFLRVGNSDDYTPVSEASLSTLIQAELFFKENFDTVTQLMANCPIRNAETIINQYNYFIDNNSDFVISCFEYGWMNPWWAVSLDVNNRPTRLFEDTCVRSQDLPSLFCPTGATWMAKSNKLKESKTFYGNNHQYFIMPWQQAVDIDSYDDLEFAKCIYNTLKVL